MKITKEQMQELEQAFVFINEDNNTITVKLRGNKSIVSVTFGKDKIKMHGLPVKRELGVVKKVGRPLERKFTNNGTGFQQLISKIEKRRSH